MPNDVTAGYIIADVEQLRKPMQLITDFILKNIGICTSAEIITIQAKEKEFLSWVCPLQPIY